MVGTGLLTFDGNGTITAGNIETNVNGDFQKSNEIPVPGIGTGTYSVSSDGTCTISIPQDPFNAVLDLQWSCVVESNEKVRFIGQTNPGFYSMIEGTLTRQGQTVALLELDGFYTADINAYKTKFGLNVPVQVVTDDQPASSTAIEILLAGGRSVRITPGFDPATLRQLLAVLQEVPPC